MSYPLSHRAGGRLRWAGLLGLIAALSICLLPGVADAKKKKAKKNTPVKVLSYNLYLGSGLTKATSAGLANRTDLFADDVGEVLANVQTNDFAARAQTVANDIKKQKIDVAGLQEAALWKLEIPTDGGGPPRGSSATTPLIDYLDTLINALNQKAKTKKQCKKKGLKGDKCYRGYYLVGFTQEADVEQPGDFDNNPGPDGKTCDLSSGTCPPPPGSDSWLWGNDDTPGVNFGEPPSPPFPSDANFDVSPFNGSGGGTDCPDGNPGAAPVPPFPAGFGAANAPVCMFHGIDGDIRLQMRDAIIARKGVKASNVTSGNYAPQNTLSFTVFGLPLSFTRGWVAADVNVNGKKFHLLNTHLESENNGSIREDQAQQLVTNTFGPGAGLHPNTVLVGDLNSDPARTPTNLPDGDGSSNIAINRLFAAGYMPIEVGGLSSGHAELLNNLSDTLDNSRIDHILTNNPLIRVRSGQILDSIGGGLWASDHGGVVSRLDVPGGKKKGKK